MAGLPDAKIDIVRTLVAGAPDKVISGLRNALAAAEGDTALAGVRRVVEAEVAERNLRNKALQPVAPLFIDRRGDPDRLAFPPRALPMLWRGLRDVAAEDVATAALAMADYEPGVTSNEAFDPAGHYGCAGRHRDRPTGGRRSVAHLPGHVAGRAPSDGETPRLDQPYDAGTGGRCAAGLS